MTSKGVLGSIFLLLVLGMAGCIFMMRGCLSKYDERSAIPGMLYFENDTGKMVVCIVKYDKATSYQQHGGFTSKSVSTTYSLQSNDGVTGVKLKEQKIKDHEDVKEYPVEILGDGGGMVWLYAGELMAYNPASLEKVADKIILETKTPGLRGKLPLQRKYYHFNSLDHSIDITLTDGTKYKLNTNTLLASGINADDVSSDDQAIEEVGLQIKRADEVLDSLYKHPGQDAVHYNLNNRVYSIRDSLRQKKQTLENMKRLAAYKTKETENLSQVSVNYSSIKKNSDTINGKFYGLYSPPEFKQLSSSYHVGSEYDETARRQLYTTTISKDRNNYYSIDKPGVSIPKPSQTFLHGGFLMDKTTGLPAMSGANYLVVHKTTIGNEGKILVSKMDTSSGVAWTTNTELKDWIDYKLTPQRLYVFGTNNPEISFTAINMLLIIDLQNGHISRFDYFTDKSL